MKDGEYALTSGEKEGARPGVYKIAIFASDGIDSTKAPVLLVNEKYRDENKSGLKAEVKPDAPGGAYDFAVTK